MTHNIHMIIPHAKLTKADDTMSTKFPVSYVSHSE